MMIKRFFICLCIASVVFVSCKKTKTTTCPYSNSTVVATAAETDSLDTLLKDSGIVAMKDPAGFYYTINTQGTASPITSLCQNVSVTYKGKFFNSKIFDSTATGQIANFELGQVILGWQKGVPLIGKGGDITLYLPPSLAYGSTAVGDNNGNTVIPASSYLIFEIQLLDVQ